MQKATLAMPSAILMTLREMIVVTSAPPYAAKGDLNEWHERRDYRTSSRNPINKILTATNLAPTHRVDRAYNRSVSFR